MPSGVLGSPTVSRLREQEALASRRVAELSARYGADHPGARAAAADGRYAPLARFYLARLLPRAAARVAEIEAADSLLALMPAA